MRFKYKAYLSLSILVVAFLILFLGYPRGASILFSSKKQCRVMRVEAFMKGMVMNGPANQMNKFSIACDDGSICRAEDTGFAAVKPGDLIEFRGYPEFGTVEEFNKCDHAQLIRIIEDSKSTAPATPTTPQVGQAPQQGMPTQGVVPMGTSGGNMGGNSGTQK